MVVGQDATRTRWAHAGTRYRFQGHFFNGLLKGLHYDYAARATVAIVAGALLVLKTLAMHV